MYALSIGLYAARPLVSRRPRCARSPSHSVVRRPSHVLAQQVRAEVALEIAPHRVDVVPVVLRVVVLDQKRRALHTVVVLLTALEWTGPGEANLVSARLL